METLEEATRKVLNQYAINEFIDDMNFHISTLKAQEYIQPLISEWYNNGGILQ